MSKWTKKDVLEHARLLKSPFDEQKAAPITGGLAPVLAQNALKRTVPIKLPVRKSSARPQA